jgi:hypothetical protein
MSSLLPVQSLQPATVKRDSENHGGFQQEADTRMISTSHKSVCSFVSNATAHSYKCSGPGGSVILLASWIRIRKSDLKIWLRTEYPNPYYFIKDSKKCQKKSTLSLKFNDLLPVWQHMSCQIGIGSVSLTNWPFEADPLIMITDPLIREP